MKIDWKARAKNPYFWVGMLGVVLTAMGVGPDRFTSWEAVCSQFTLLVQNPYLLGCVIMAVLGVITDGSTAGFNDCPKLPPQKEESDDGVQ